jgi:PleD family two-component response regulator
LRTNLAIGSIAGKTAAVTASFGVADSTDAAMFGEVVECADAALRQAKETGRNRIVNHRDVVDGSIVPSVVSEPTPVTSPERG